MLLCACIYGIIHFCIFIRRSLSATLNGALITGLCISWKNFTFCCQLSLSPEIRTRIGLKLQNARLKLDTRKNPF